MDKANTNRIRNRLRELCRHPRDGIQTVCRWKENEPGFFPAASGFAANPQPPVRTMMLGNNFGDADYYEDFMAGRKRDVKGKTWINLQRLLRRVDKPQLSEENCFYTNGFMDLMPKGMLGMTPGAKDKTYRSDCLEILKEQMREQQPASVICLGGEARELLSQCSHELAVSWKGQSLKDIDADGLQIVTAVLDGVALPVTVAALLHPSMRHGNLHRRRYLDVSGLHFANNEAEVKVLRRVAELMPALETI
jgi:hypothetical protein